MGEIDGRQYNFISPKEYLKLLNEKKLMACSRIEHNYYGMPLLEEKLQENNGMDLLIDMGSKWRIGNKGTIPRNYHDIFNTKNRRTIIKAER